jgi:hypothetical protein
LIFNSYICFGNYIQIMKKLILLACFSLLAFATRAQTIHRWKSNSKEIKSNELTYQVYSNIFNDYGWTYPDIKCREIPLNKDGYRFDFKGSSYDIIKSSEEIVTVSKNGNIIASASRQKSRNDIYYNKKLLKLKAVTRSRWVSHTYYRSTMTAVTRYRPVTNYVYDYNTKSSHPVYSQQAYTALESHLTPYSVMEWQNYTEYVIDIPVYEHFSFTLNDSSHFIIYDAGGHYYLQNTSYAIARDDDKVNYVLVDNNQNGSFTDEDDEIMFNTWNPFNKSSKFRSSIYFRENAWQTIGYLAATEFLLVDISGSKLTIDNKNDKYIGGGDKGRLYVENLPDKTTCFINGEKYHLNDRKRGFKTEYGIFNLKISKPGFLDFDTTYTVNESNENIKITYRETGKASEFTIKNLYSKNYYVTVKNPSGYSKTYHNINKINIPEGKNEIEIYTDGNSIPFQASSSAGEEIVYDFEAELKKMTTHAKDVKDDDGEEKKEPEKNK